MVQREQQETDVVVREISIDASPDIVYSFFTDPTKMAQWKGRKATLDPRPDGDYVIEISDVATARGSYVELVPNERVVFTWGWDGSADVPPGSSTVEVTLEPRGDGTFVRLVHRNLPNAQERENHGIGWDHYLPRLVTIAEGGDPGPDAHA